MRSPNSFEIDGVIQTDAAINPGNRTLHIDATGRVIGINSQIETGGGGNGHVGIGFAIQIDTAKRLLPARRRTVASTAGSSVDSVQQQVARAGTSTSRSTTAPSSRPCRPGSPAAKAGITGGDIVAQLNGNEVGLGGDGASPRSTGTFARATTWRTRSAAKKHGDTVKIEFVHDGATKTHPQRQGLAERTATPSSGQG